MAWSDTLVGGGGVDTAVYSGKRADYKLIIGEDGQFKVGDKASGALDVLSGIEAGVQRRHDRFVVPGCDTGQPASRQQLGLMYQPVLDRSGDMSELNWWLPPPCIH